MRRSGAPSAQSSAKRLRFLTPFIDRERESFELDQENDLMIHSVKSSHISESIAVNSSLKSNAETLPFNADSGKETLGTCRSTDEILKLISEPASGGPCYTNESNTTINENFFDNNWDEIPTFETTLKADSEKLSVKCQSNVKNTSIKIKPSPEKVSIRLPPVSKYVAREQKPSASPKKTDIKFQSSITEFDQPCDAVKTNGFCFSVMWCKRSAKKHKVWEGDAILVITNRSAVLKDMEGKVIDRGIGYKSKEIEELEEGSKFYIGGKECEIQSCIPFENNNVEETSLPSGKFIPSNDSTKSTLAPKFRPLSIKFKCPEQKGMQNIETSINEADILILPDPSEEHQKMYNKDGLPLTTVRVDVFLVKNLRNHQKEGIIFMYKCIMGFQHELGHGVILADEMGLGKTLQCIALIWTLYRKGPFGGKPVLKKVIIITPSSLVANWKKEFHKWLGESRMAVFSVDKKNTIKDFIKMQKPVLIISYEMFLRSAELLSSVSFDLVVCDEGHRIKNINIKISNVINCLTTTRRILLTGTPIQNDLAEYFSIVDFVNPGALGTIQSFRRSFEKPIMQSRNQECSEEEKVIGEERSEELNLMSSLFMLRRTQDVINQYLPPKSEIVVFCRPTELQNTLYKYLLNFSSLLNMITRPSGFSDASQQLVYISILRKLCNHPSLLYDQSMDENHMLSDISSAFPNNYQPSPRDSGKMKVLEAILESIFSSPKKEKIVIVSGFTQTLNLIEKMCKSKHYCFLRLDGSTTTSSRQDIVDQFNLSYTKYSIFLLSSKAGGVGFNLIGASRILLYDIDWNPANDLQAMARIWRDGQKRSVFIYRLLTTGTIEEKIYQRQLSKQCLSGSVLNPNSNEKLKFSLDELKDLFTLHEDTECLTHDLINCCCLENKTQVNTTEMGFKSSSHFLGMEELMNWKHIPGPIEKENIKDLTLVSSDITFLFVNETHTNKQS